MVLPDLDDAVEHSAAPAVVRLAIERLAAAHPGIADRLATDEQLRAAVVAVTGASRSLTRLLETDARAVDVLADLSRRAATPDAGEGVAELVRRKRLELLRIAARDLLGVDPLEATGAALAGLAADVLHAACALAGAGAGGMAVIGMGKLGGAELNYASDVDIVIVAGAGAADAERCARAVVDIARQCFRVDLNLRPEGRDGPLVRSLESYEAYWERWAQPWEFQALLKARAVAGDRELGARFDASAAVHLWSRPFGADELRSVRAMKQRAEEEVARRGLSDRELKLGRGGIRDVEFAVQLLQLVHGGADPELRSPTTLDALGELADAGYVGRHDADALAHAYRFLRTLEHRLQLHDEQQVHAVPSAARAREHLARVLGYRGTPHAGALEQLDRELAEQQRTVRAIHERLYFRPLLEAFTSSGGTAMSHEAAAARLAAFGFADAARTRQALDELTRGLTRSSRLMQQLLPLLLEWLSDSPDPDSGLLGLRNLASGPQRSMELATAFRESPEVARRLCCVLGTSRRLAELLEHNPDVITTLGDPDQLRLLSRDELLEGTRAALAWRPSAEDRRRALKRFTDREGLRVATNDILDLAPQADIGPGLTALAEAALEASLETHEPPLPFAVIAVGRFGGGDLSYASDLDVLFVYDGATSDDFARAEALATSLLRFVGGSVPHLYDIDPDLRPEGKQGPLARSLEGYATYFERWAQPWERLAMVRARPCAGDMALGHRFIDVAAEFVWHRPVEDEERREIRRVKARVERERIPAGEDPQFHLKLGRGSLSDVEFCAQLLQLEHGIRAPGTQDALQHLGAAGALDRADREVLAASYAFCERTRNRWFLVNSGPGDSLPTQPEKLARLAHSLGTTSAELRDEYRRVTRRARRVVERLFYGRD